MVNTSRAWVFGLISLLMLSLIITPFPASAYPVDWEWEDPWHYPPGEDPPEELPEMPPCGYYTVDCPSASSSTSNNVFWEYRAKYLHGGSAFVYDYAMGSNGMWDGYLITGGFTDIYTYGEYQTMPLGNATILDVWLMMNYTTPNNPGPYVGKLQYSLGGSTWNMTGDEYIINFSSETHYSFKGVNVTDLYDWTPQTLMSESFFVRLWSYDLITQANGFWIDYLGLRYNWTLNYTLHPDPEGYWDWGNSTLGSMDFGGIIVGGMGMIGFAGMIAVPAITLWRARDSDSRMMIGVYGIVAFTACLGLFLASMGI